MNGNLKRPYHKVLEPVGFDIWDRSVVTGRAITSGAVVTVITHFGPFRLVRDRFGNVNSVGKGSLVPVPAKVMAQYKAEVAEAARERALFRAGRL